MKRWPLLASFLLFILVCVSIAYWAMQLFKPPLRPVAAPPRAVANIRPQAAAVLFGGRAGKTAVASNFQLKGVVMAGSPGESVAILSANGKPARAIAAGKEVAPDVTVKEVHRNYVLLSDGGVIKRVDLPESAKEQVDFAALAPVGTHTAPATGQQGSAAPSSTAQRPLTPQTAPSGPPGSTNSSSASRSATGQAQAAGGQGGQAAPAGSAAGGSSTAAPPTVVTNPPASPQSPRR